MCMKYHRPVIRLPISIHIFIRTRAMLKNIMTTRNFRNIHVIFPIRKLKTEKNMWIYLVLRIVHL
jgi:hypothetical protein